MTKARKRVLEYVRDNEPVALFPMPLANLRNAVADGQVEAAGSEPRPMGFTLYRLTQAGRDALDAI